jgi:hypothetical protein
MTTDAALLYRLSTGEPKIRACPKSIGFFSHLAPSYPQNIELFGPAVFYEMCRIWMDGQTDGECDDNTHPAQFGPRGKKAQENMHNKATGCNYSGISSYVMYMHINKHRLSYSDKAAASCYHIYMRNDYTFFTNWVTLCPLAIILTCFCNIILPPF